MNGFLRTVLVLCAWLTLAGCGMLAGVSVQSTQAPPVDPAARKLPPSVLPVSPATLPPADVRVIPAESRPEAPSPAPVIAATATTPPPAPRQLTQGGCCVNPTWSSDSQRVLYFDRPTSQDQAGIWGIDLQGGSPVFVTAQWAIYSNDQALRAFPSSGQTIVERVSDGQRWTIPNDGRSVVFSMDGVQLGWTAGRSQPPFDSTVRQIWVSQADGSGARQVMSVLSGGISGWFPDGQLLVNGRLENIDLGQALWVLTPPTVEGGDWNAAELLQAKRIRGAIISPDGNWLAYVSAFSGDPNQDGLWLLHIRSGEKRRLEIFGAYRWRDASRLLVIPLELDQPFHRLLQVNLSGGGIETLTNPETSPFKIANGDWSVSPDGSHLAYVSAMDGNIWVIDLP